MRDTKHMSERPQYMIMWYYLHFHFRHTTCVKLLLKVKWQSQTETTRRTSNLEINNQRKSTKALLVWVQFPYLQFLNFLSHYLLSVEILSEQGRAKRLMWAGGRQ